MSQSEAAYQDQKQELLVAYEKIANLEQELNTVKRQVSRPLLGTTMKL